MMQVLRRSFLQLLVVYTVFIALISLGFLGKYTLHFEIFALILAGFGVLAIKEENDFRINILFLIPLIALVFLFRSVPYLNNSVPLGYDPGIYKYIMETYLKSLPDLPKENIDLWIRSGFEPGLFVITDLLYTFGFDTQSILTWVFIFFEVLLGLGIYAAAKRFFGKEVGILSLLIYSISIVQFKVFWYMYYKNVVALFVMLISLHLFKSGKYLPFVLTAASIGAVHRPTFLIFGLVYLSYIIACRREFIKNILAGAAILAITLTFYIPNFKEAIAENIEPIITANIGAGTFISFFIYQFSSLSYLPFALLGFLILARKRETNFFFFWFLIAGIIVYFKLIFFNRFIIHLDIVMIILAALGLYELTKFNKKFGSFILLILFISSLIFMNQNVNEARPLVSKNELEIINKFNYVENDSYVMSVSSYYSPWVLGYSGRKTIAPGLFDYNNWSFDEWKAFWATGDKEKAREMLEVYKKPLYIYLGERDRINETKFENDHFDKIYQEDRMKIFRVR